MSNEALKKRIRCIRKGSSAGKCVIYVMSRDQRAQENHALFTAQKHAIAKKLPFAVVFCLYEKSGHRAREHYEFMIAGLREVETELKLLNIPFMMLIGDPKQRIAALIHHVEPDAVYFDFSPLNGPRVLVEALVKSSESHCTLYVVDTHNVVPLWELSDKKEVAAYTLRPKMHRKLGEFLIEPGKIESHPTAWPGVVRSIQELSTQVDEVLNTIPSNGTIVDFVPGSKAAQAHLDVFINERLRGYAEKRNDPALNFLSDLSPYLHFGHISSLRVALNLQEELAKTNDTLHLLESPKMPQASGLAPVRDGVNALLEEMLVRKELSDNFCYYEPNYRELSSAPKWAQESLDQHRSDPREHLYTYEELVQAHTHDIAWNAAQIQMTKTGKMHGYMRMYWAKKVLEWTESPEQAIEFLITMNDFYSIDGGDPNGYVGILWSVAGVHDRPWTEREVFGKIRYMNYGGLKRKFDIAAYEQDWSKLISR